MSRQILATPADESDPVELASIFSALADPTRLRLLNLMREQEVCVCYFVAVLKTTQPKISRHLAYLRRAGIVSARRSGKWMHYRISVPRNSLAERVLHDLFRAFDRKPEMQRDRQRMESACCSPTRFGLAGPPELVEIAKA
jgi:ArsR family transcriptional regulator